MERREKMLKRLSRKENILELINEYGKNPRKEELRVYENKINAVCLNLKYSQSCKDNKIRSLYYAMVIPYLDRIRDCIKKIDTVQINEEQVLNSITNYYGTQIGILSDSVIQCSISKFLKMSYKELDKEADKAFINALREDEVMLKSIFMNFGYWTISLFSFLENTTKYLEETLHNLNNDSKEIADRVFKSVFAIKDIALEVGDRHNNTFVLKFITTETDLYYKPRSNEIEDCLEKIVKTIRKYNNKILEIKFPEMYATKEYQWVKSNDYTPLKNEEEEKRYYYRLGEILALYYILDGNDLHFENVISSGEYPILIDTETIFTNRMMLKRKDESGYIVKNENSYGIVSVKDIGIVPNYIKVGEKSIDISSINFNSSKDDIENNENFNIDKSKLHVACQFITWKETEACLLEGFTVIYNAFVEFKEPLLKDISYLVEGITVRYLKHPTNDYAKIKHAVMKPICYFDYAYAFAASARVYGDGKVPEQIELCEQRDLLALNIPRFELNVNEKYILWNQEEKIEDYFCESAWKVVCDKINYLGKEDLENQSKIIEMMFASKKGLDLKEPKEYLADVERNEQMLNEYRSIIKEIVQQMQYNPISREPFFIGYQLLGEQYQVLPFPNNYYSGIIGLLSILLNDPDYKEMDYVKNIVGEFVNLIDKKIKTMGRDVLTGAYDGLGMYIKIIQQVYNSNLMKSSQYKESMKAILDKCKDAVWNDTKHDILNGNAGLLLTLVNAIEEEREDDVKTLLSEIMKTTVITMKEKVTRYEGKTFYAADNVSKLFFTGYGHGSAGIIVALYKAMKKMDDIDENLLQSLIETERKFYNPKEGIWYKDNKCNSSSWGWCHGIPGILLSRIELWLEGYRDNRIIDEINELIDLSIEKALGYNTTYCHGDIGILTILQYAYEVIEEDKRLEYIQYYKEKLIQEVLLRRKDRIVRGMESVGLMDGILGIAHFLRCEANEHLAIDVLTVKNMEKLGEEVLC